MLVANFHLFHAANIDEHLIAQKEFIIIEIGANKSVLILTIHARNEVFSYVARYKFVKSKCFVVLCPYARIQFQEIRIFEYPMSSNEITQRQIGSVNFSL